jgi:hypothetical protein
MIALFIVKMIALTALLVVRTYKLSSRTRGHEIGKRDAIAAFLFMVFLVSLALLATVVDVGGK